MIRKLQRNNHINKQLLDGRNQDLELKLYFKLSENRLSMFIHI